ncbi:MAG: cation diffusion facilitator family transporter [Thermodesulfovibrionales bacterium]
MSINMQSQIIFVHGGKGLAALSLGLNIFLTASKYLLYLFTNSSALLAETVHSLTDVIGSLMVIGGIYLSEKKSEKFPWGLYKVENLAAVFSAGFIFLSAYEIAKMIYHPSTEGVRNLDITLIALFLMSLPIIFFARYEARRAKELNSPSLIADADHWRMDIAPLAVVAAGLLGARLSYPFMDRISALVVLLLVLKSGYEILKDSMRSLLDASVDKETLDKIKEVIRIFPQVKEIGSLHARNSGRFIFVTIDLGLSLKRLKDAHEIADSIIMEIKARIPFVERVLIHYEPERKDYQRYAVPLANAEGDISEHFAKAPFVALCDLRISDGQACSKEVLENPFTTLEKGKGLRLAELLVERQVDVLYTKEDFSGKGPSHVFSAADVEVRKTDARNIAEIVHWIADMPAESLSGEILKFRRIL